MFGGLSYATEENYCNLESLDKSDVTEDETDQSKVQMTQESNLTKKESDRGTSKNDVTTPKDATSKTTTDIEFNSFENFFPNPTKGKNSNSKQEGSIDFTMELSSNISNSIKQERSKSKNTSIREERVSKRHPIDTLNNGQVGIT